MRASDPRRTLAARRLILAGAGVLLLLGLWAGLARIGWDLPWADGTLLRAHAGLLIAGFVGSLIALERAVALAVGPALAAPASSALGAAWLVAGGAADVGIGLILVAAILLVTIFVMLMATRRASVELAVMSAGAGCWAAGAVLWLADRPMAELVPWWMAFLGLTILPERLELARFRRRHRAARLALIGLAGTLLAGLVAVEVAFDAGSVLVAAVLVGMALWLAAFDDWRRPLRRGGQGRYAALAMLLGALWLGAGGAIWLWVGPVRFGPHYDAVVHAFFLGFVISGILAHGTIILPSVSGRSVRFGWRLLAPLLLLHGSLAVRVAADLEGWRDGREWGGLFNAVALVVFLVCMASLSLPAGRRGAAWLRVQAAEHVTAPSPGSRTR